MSGDVSSALENVGSDGSEIRTMSTYADGSTNNFALRPESTSFAVHYERVHSVSYVMSGHGMLWRASEDREELTRLHAGLFFDIPPGVEFQVRSSGLESLSIVTLTMPASPGLQAVRATKPKW
jgi:mannose-6-phosphate isomerase-like protein (cupin superfamily)